MLSPYTRHYAPCKQVDISLGRYKCSKWMQGNLPDGRYLRKSPQDAELGEGGAALPQARRRVDPNKPEARPRAKLVCAIQTFREDEDSRRLTKAPSRRAGTSSRRIKRVAQKEGLVYLDQLTPAVLTKFRSGWTNAAQTMQRKHERLIAFLWFCVRIDWMTKNPPSS